MERRSLRHDNRSASTQPRRPASMATSSTCFRDMFKPQGRVFLFSFFLPEKHKQRKMFSLRSCKTEMIYKLSNYGSFWAVDKKIDYGTEASPV